LRAPGASAATVSIPWGVHDHSHTCETDEGTDDVEAVGPVTIGNHAPPNRPGHEDPTVGGEDPTEVRIGWNVAAKP
jgi:hypothetical protein